MIAHPRDWPLAVRALALLLVAQLVGLGLLFWNGERLADRTSEAELARLRTHVLPNLAAAAAPAVFEQDLEQLGRLLGPWAGADGVGALRLTTARGRVLYETVTPWAAPPGAAHLALPVEIGPMALGTLEITLDEGSYRATARQSATSGMLVVAAGTTFWTLVLILLAMRLGRQLSGLATAATAIAEGATDVRADVAGPPELRALARSFNTMVDRLLDANARIDEERQRLEYSERRLRDFASAASDWLWETDAEGRFVYLSQQNDPRNPLGQERFLGRRREKCVEECDPQALRVHLEAIEQRRPFRDFRYRLRDRFGRLRTIEVSGVPQFDSSGRFRGYRGVGRDVTEREEAARRIVYLARHDTLTRLANRAAFIEQLRRALAIARRDGSMVALHLFDVDAFRRVNELYGQGVGDAVLLELAERITVTVREGDLAARLAADEFAVLQPGVHSPEQASALAERLVRRLAEPCGESARRLCVDISCGIALFPADATDAETLFGRASMALARAKAAGGGCFRFFEAAMEAAERRRRTIEAELRRALADERPPGLELHFQPRVDLASGAPLGAEALLRWRHAELGDLSPAVFVPVAEQAGLMQALGGWVIREACRVLAGWRDRMPDDFRLAVNLSPVQFHRRDIVREVAAALARHDLPPGRLELEITESTLMADTEGTVRQLRRFRELGIPLALDDFGTGYSSLAYLKRFALDKIKIDRSFVMGLENGGENAAIVRAIVTLAHSLELGVVAEGVETEEQRAFLLREGCSEGQGFLFAPPIPRAQFERRWLPPAQAGPAAEILAFSRPDCLLPAPAPQG